jgi:hypothetical protein
MTRYKTLLLSVTLGVSGFILNGLAYTVLPGPELNTIAFFCGVAMMLAGFILFIIALFKK